MFDLADDTFASELVEPTPDELAAQASDVVKAISDLDPASLAAHCGSLFYQPSLHSSVVRIEAMVQLAMTKSTGGSPASADDLKLLFDALANTSLTLFADSPGDVQAGTVWFQGQNFCVLNGVWRANACNLQRVLWIVETMPNDGRFDEFKACVNALLALSQVACVRASLAPNHVDSGAPTKQLRDYDLVSPSVVCFSKEDLNSLGIGRDSLRPFIALPKRMMDASKVPIASSPMQRYPLAASESDIVLAMPTAVGVAIREFVVRFAIGNQMLPTFAKALVGSYSRWLTEERVFGADKQNPIVFEDSEIGPLAELRLQEEGGEFAQVLFLFDNTESIEKTDTVGPWPTHPKLSRVLKEKISNCLTEAQVTSRYECGLTLIVTCGFGRQLYIPELDRLDQNWHVETVDVDDLVHMSRTEEIDAFYLLKILRAKDKAEKLGVTFSGDIDFVNFVAFVRHQHGNVVPHSEMPKDARNQPLNVLISPDFAADLRAFSHQRTDMRLATRADGTAMRVRRSVAHISDFACLTPTYTALRMTEAETASVYVTQDSHWWFVLRDQPRSSVGYERYQMLLTWLRRTVPVVQPIAEEKEFDVVEIHFRFLSPVLHSVGELPESYPTVEEIENDIAVEVDRDQNVITLTIGPEFENGMGHATNVSELAMLRRVVSGVAQWSGHSLETSDLDRLALAITGGPDGRHMHAMVGLTFRDGFAEQLNRDAIVPDQLDDGILNLGMAFKVEPRESGRTIIAGKSESLAFLNQLVTTLEDDLCERLRRLDRTKLIRKLILNHEAAVFRRDLWRRTSKANLAMHDDYPEALETIVNRNRRCDSCIQPTRLVIEAANCECPIEGGLQPGKSDLSELMTLVNTISIVGGWSDAIYMDAMKPELEITPLGKVLSDPEFERQILQPFYTKATEIAISDSAENQVKSYPATHSRKVQAGREPKPTFENAFLEEFGFSTKDVQTLLIELVRLGEDEYALAYEMDEEELVNRLAETSLSTDAQNIVNQFILRSRATWRIAERDDDADAYHQPLDGYKQRDTHFWRLRRRLSLLRRPIVELSPGRLYIVPGMIQDAFAYTLNNYYYGAIREQDLNCKAMSKWKSVAAQEKGTEFAKRVADALNALGWKTRVERKLTEIFGKKLDRDYGDVDVLAYDPNSGRVLVIECKSLHYHKSHGEVAEQMSDWRGLTNTKGKRDDLKKHLDRIETLLADPQQVRKYLKAKTEITIEPWLMFENPVPMLHAWEGKDLSTAFTSFSEIESLFTRNK